MTRDEITKDLQEIMDDCDYIVRRIPILKQNAKAVADALAYEAKKEAAK